MKRTLAVILSAVMLFTALPLTVFAADVCEHTETQWVYDPYYVPEGETPDCTDANQKFSRKKVCKSCNTVVVGVEVIPTQSEHILSALPMYDSEGKVIEENYKRPTCTEEGELAYQCQICGTIVKKVLPASGHSYGEAVVHVRCFDPDGVSDQVSRQENGIYRRYCTNPGCNDFKEERITDHIHYGQKSKEPDCFSDGHTAFVYCVNCASETEVETIPQLQHKDENEDQLCDLCYSNYLGEGVFCSCLCHSESSFVQLLMPLLRFIWQLLGIDNCHGTCEAVHYEK